MSQFFFIKISMSFFPIALSTFHKIEFCPYQYQEQADNFRCGCSMITETVTLENLMRK